jgi:prepilin-type N-terminal cleavage/methylation domain-containing protein
MKLNNRISSFFHFRGGFTLLEVMIVCAMISLISITIIINWRTSRSNQALKTSAESFSDVLTSAHIYSREAKKSQHWGVRQTDKNSYQLVSGDESNPTIESRLSFESQINFVPVNFIVWFDIGTGETKNKQSVELENMIGKKIKIDIYKTGLVETSGIY